MALIRHENIKIIGKDLHWYKNGILHLVRMALSPNIGTFDGSMGRQLRTALCRVRR